MPPKVPCHCPRCNGALVSTKTKGRHQPKAPKIKIATFAEWMALTGGLDGMGKEEGVGGSEVDGQEQGQDEEEDEEEPLGPRKRRRIDVIHPNISNELEEENQHDEQLNHAACDFDIDEDQNRSLDGFEEDKRDDPGEEKRPEIPRTPEPEILGDDSEVQESRVPPFSRIEHRRFAQEFINQNSAATLDNGGLDASTIDYLRYPEEGPVDISDPDTRMSLDVFLSCKNASEKTYTDVRDAILTRFPDTNILSYHDVKNLVARIGGVCAINDECINGRHGFTDPSTNLCSEPRYDLNKFASSGKKVPRQQACTLPLRPQLQDLRRSPEGTQAIQYRDNPRLSAFQLIQSTGS